MTSCAKAMERVKSETIELHFKKCTLDKKNIIIYDLISDANALNYSLINQCFSITIAVQDLGREGAKNFLA